jgi:hypothetical protein
LYGPLIPVEIKSRTFTSSFEFGEKELTFNPLANALKFFLRQGIKSSVVLISLLFDVFGPNENDEDPMSL